MTKSIKINTEYVEDNNDALRYSIEGSEMGFSIVSSPHTGRAQLTRVSTCRDYVHERIRDHIAAERHQPGTPKMDFKRTRLLLVVDKDGPAEVKANIFNAKRVLNMYEKMAGWKNTSKISSVDMDAPCSAYLITGPGEWISHPVALSMATLILRIGMRVGPLPSTEKEIVEKWKQISVGSKSAIDSEYLRKTYKYFPSMMKNYTEVFKVRGEKAYDGCGHYSGGVVAMAENKGYDKELFIRVQQQY